MRKHLQSCSRVEDEDGSVHWLRGQVTLERLVDRHPVDIRVIHEPNDLGAEQFSVVLGVQVRLSRLTAVQLQTLADALPQHIQCRVRLHDLVHGPVQQRLNAWEPVAEAAVQVVGQIHTHEHTCRRRVDGHVVSGVVQELGTAIALDVVGVVVTPSELHIDPVLRGGRAIEAILGLREKGWLGDSPLVGGKEEHVRA